jgi:hypothetical protein
MGEGEANMRLIGALIKIIIIAGIVVALQCAMMISASILAVAFRKV